MRSRPIAIIDSGVGGLSIWQAIVKLLPSEDIIYFADQKNFPYGTKDEKTLRSIMSRNVDFLLKQRAKLIVIACNTATVYTLQKLRQTYTIPLVGTVPVIKKAAEISKKGRIAVLSTLATSKSAYQKNLINQFASDMDVFVVAADWLVRRVENLNTSSPQLSLILNKKLQGLKEKNIDVLVLGCTHFSFVKQHCKKIFGRYVEVLDSAGAIARQIKRVLSNNSIIASKHRPSYTFYTTGKKARLEKQIEVLLHREVSVEQI